jgi:hypothetical protein
VYIWLEAFSFAFALYSAFSLRSLLLHRKLLRCLNTVGTSWFSHSCAQQVPPLCNARAYISFHEGIPAGIYASFGPLKTHEYQRIRGFSGLFSFDLAQIFRHLHSLCGNYGKLSSNPHSVHSFYLYRIISLKVENDSSLHLPLRHFLKHLGQLFHLFHPEMSFNDPTSGHVEDLESLSLISYSRSFDNMFICNLSLVSRLSRQPN